MKIKFGTQELEIERAYYTARKQEDHTLDETMMITLKKDTKASDIFAILDSDFTGEFTVIRDGVDDETFTGYEFENVARNIEITSDQSTISFSK